MHLGGDAGGALIAEDVPGGLLEEFRARQGRGSAELHRHGDVLALPGEGTGMEHRGKGRPRQNPRRQRPLHSAWVQESGDGGYRSFPRCHPVRHSGSREESSEGGGGGGGGAARRAGKEKWICRGSSQDRNAEGGAAGKALGRGMARDGTQRGGSGESKGLLGEAEEHEGDDPSQHDFRKTKFVLWIPAVALKTRQLETVGINEALIEILFSFPTTAISEKLF